MEAFGSTRREFLTSLAAGATAAGATTAATAAAGAQAPQGIARFVRFRKGSATAHGILDAEEIREIQGDLFGQFRETKTRHRLSDVKLLYPVQAGTVFALAGNYRSHLGTRAPSAHPEVFYKPITSL